MFISNQTSKWGLADDSSGCNSVISFMLMCLVIAMPIVSIVCLHDKLQVREKKQDERE